MGVPTPLLAALGGESSSWRSMYCSAMRSDISCRCRATQESHKRTGERENAHYFVAALSVGDDDGEKKKKKNSTSTFSLSQKNSKKKLQKGYLFTYYNTKITEERKAQIERINQQVRDLYGPLLATVNASRTAYRAMVRAHSPPSGDGSAAAFVAAVRRDPDGAEARVYRTWMRDVLQPLNERAAAIVVDVSEVF